MAQPIDAYLQQAVADFEVALAAHRTRESPFLRAEKVSGARLFVTFLLGRPLPSPFPAPALEPPFPEEK